MSNMKTRTIEEETQDDTSNWCDCVPHSKPSDVGGRCTGCNKILTEDDVAFNEDGSWKKR